MRTTARAGVSRDEQRRDERRRDEWRAAHRHLALVLALAAAATATSAGAAIVPTAAIASARRRAQASHGRHEHRCNGAVLATASIPHVTTRDLYLACANGVNCENNLCPRMRYRAWYTSNLQ